MGWPQEDQRRWPQHFLCCSTSDCSPIFPTARVSSSLKCLLNGHGFLLILYSELNPDLPAPVRALTQTLSASPLNVFGLRSFHLNLCWVLSTISASSISVGMRFGVVSLQPQERHCGKLAGKMRSALRGRHQTPRLPLGAPDPCQLLFPGSSDLLWQVPKFWGF